MSSTTKHPLPATDTERRSKPAGRPKASELEARAQNLIHTAACLFLQHGYGNVSLETIAREAHVAVRTIYIKFGGKAGLLKAAIEANRGRFYAEHALENDTRPLRESLTEFAHQHIDLISAPQAVAMKRMVLAEANSNPELTQTFLTSGPDATRAMLGHFFNQPETRAQMRADLPFDELPTFLLNCLAGDPFAHLLDPDSLRSPSFRAAMLARLELFFHAILRAPAA
jgi:TetR/AcrR family transcriptional repressor of mexJK operon